MKSGQGKQIVKLEKLPFEINPKSIQVQGFENGKILSVKHEIAYPSTAKKGKEETDLEKIIKDKELKIKDLKNKIRVCDLEEKLLLDNSQFSKKEGAANVKSIMEAADFYRIRLNSIRTESLNYDREIDNLQREISEIKKQITEIQNMTDKTYSQIFVSIDMTKEMSGTLIFSYYVPSAQWYPTYDFRVDDVSKPLNIVYNAIVNQTTDEEWKQVKLTLSASNPSIAGTKPELTTWYLDGRRKTTSYTSTVGGVYNEYGQVKSVRGAREEPAFFFAEKASPELKRKTQSYSESKNTATNIEYAIDIPYNIPSDGQEYSIKIKEVSLPVNYVYQVVPKLDNDAFLVAEIVDWSELNLLAGKTSIYYQGTFTSESVINPDQAEDTLSISLGRDKNVFVKREGRKELSDNKIIGNNVRKTAGWDITLRNNKTTKVKVIVEDQLPISEMKTIGVEKIDLAGATLDEKKGKLTWILELEPNEKKTITYKYAVKYPNYLTIELD
jgi:uncharacterized protein (TIGR02231 family)